MCVQDKLPLKDCNAQDTSCLCAPSGQNSGAWQGQQNLNCFGLSGEGEGFWQTWLPDLSSSRFSLKGGMTDEPSCKVAWQAVSYSPLVLIMHIFCMHRGIAKV